jgi:iron complex outermembrane receptor protein
MKLKRFMLLLSAAAGAMTTNAVAAEQPKDKGADSGSDVVVITAQKREQNLQEVPVAVSAFSSATPRLSAPEPAQCL